MKKLKTREELQIEINQLEAKISELESSKLKDSFWLDNSPLKGDEKYRELVNLAQEGIWVIDKNNTTSFVNPSMAKMLGYSAEEMLGKSLFDFMDETGIKISNKNIERRQAGLKDQHDFEFIRKNGDRIIASLETSPILDKLGNYNGAIAGVMNITKRKQAEEALCKSEAQLRVITDNLPVLVSQIDSNFKYVFVNKYYYDKSELQGSVVGKNVVDIIGKETFNIAYPNMLKALSGEFVRFENSHQNKNGLIVFETNYIPHIIDGIVESFFVLGIDLTERKKAEEKTRTTEQNLKNTFDISPSIICKADVDSGYFIEANQAVTRILGYSVEEFKSKPIIEFVHPDDRQRTLDEGSAQLKGKEVTFFENRYLCKDGSFKWMAWHTTKANENSIVTAIASDISEQKIVEQDLIKAKEKAEQSKEKVNQINAQLSLSIDKMPTGYILWDNNLRAIEWNKAAETIFGFSRQEMIGNNPIDYIVPQEVRPIIVEVMKKLKVGETADYSAKNNNLNKNGTLISCRWFNTPLIDNSGKVIGIQSIALDITKQIKAEELLRESEENLLKTFDLSPSIIAKANLDTGYFIEANQAVTRILGYSVEEFISRPFMEFIHPDDRQPSVDESSDQLKGKEVTFFENRYLCKDGSFKWLAWNGTKADEEGMVTAIGTDISERKQTEGALSKSNELNTRLLQTIPFGMDIVDEKGNILFMSDKFEKLFGSDAIGDKCWDIYRDCKQQCPNCPLHAGIQIGETSSYESTGILGGKTFLINHTGILFQGKKAMLEIFQDITERKLSEIELIAAKEKAEESDRLKSAFLSNMSHEIRTPLNGILGFIDLLNEPDLSKDEIKEYTAVINRGGNRLLTTINDIIDISRIESGEMGVMKEETAVNSMMDELHSFFSPEVKLKGLSLLLKPATEYLIINTDSHKLHGVLTNLIKNAIKFTDKGSITFGYVLKKDTIVNEQGGSTQVEFFVSDTGSGIPTDRLQAIFRRFEQADIEDVRALEGSGLGLAISTAYVEMLGGEMFVESEEGKGSKFTFTIPYIRPNKNASVL